MIEGVVIKKLVTHPDERGFFREIIRATDGFFAEGFGQWSHSLMYAGVAKAWHVHRVQTDWWYVAGGRAQGRAPRPAPRIAHARDDHGVSHGRPAPREGARVPPGVAHGCRCLCGAGAPFYMTSKMYDPADEGRIAHDDPAIGYDWTAGPPSHDTRAEPGRCPTGGP